MISDPAAPRSTAASSWAAEIDALVALLPPAEASALDAVYRRELGLADAAVSMSVSVRQVRHHVARGLRLLGHHLVSYAQNNGAGGVGPQPDGPGTV